MTKKTGAESEEEVETTDAEEETTDDASEEEESTEEESEEEESTEDNSGSSTEEELDLDAEIEKERKAGEPDPAIADKAFKDRKNKREGDDDAAERPLTQKDLDAALARDRKERQADDALAFAKKMASSDKEAELIVAKWDNRTFPKGLSLLDQIQEAYVITHSKKLIGERDEALRALKGKNGIRKDAVGTHRDAAKSGNEPKLTPQDAAAIRASGFAWNNVSRQYEKKLPNGRMLIRDNKTKQVRLLKK